MPVSGSAAQDWFQEAGYDLLPVTPAHAAAVEHLPDHHRDPFDRLLVAPGRDRAHGAADPRSAWWLGTAGV